MKQLPILFIQKVKPASKEIYEESKQFFPKDLHLPSGMKKQFFNFSVSLKRLLLTLRGNTAVIIVSFISTRLPNGLLFKEAISIARWGEYCLLFVCLSLSL